MANRWFYLQSGREVGPVALTDLQNLVAGGQLKPGDEVWRQGTADWRPVRSVPELAEHLPPVAAKPARSRPPESTPESAPEVRSEPDDGSRLAVQFGCVLTAGMAGAVLGLVAGMLPPL